MARILVVDDVPDNITLLAYSLEEHGHQVVEAESGIEALALAESERPDAILLDVMMPVMDGREVCRRLKDTPTLADIPVIMVTAKNEDRDIVAGLDCGAEDYVTKPFNVRILMARLAAVLRTKRAQDAARRSNARLNATNELLDVSNKQLAEINQAAYEFVNNVSHDFRTPLGAIKEFASILSLGLDGPVSTEQKEYLDIISNCVDDLVFMVNDMLDISKLEAGRLTVHRMSCKIDGILERAKSTLQRKAEASHVELNVQTNHDLPEVYCDSQKIGRVIINLVINAIKFVGENGHVCISVQPDDEASQLVVQITDDGPGIAPDKLRVIFERFKQVGSNVRASAKGVGLGLNIAKELVSLNFGKLSVESQLGQGSTFSFTIPYADHLSLLERYIDQLAAAPGPEQDISFLTIGLSAGCEADIAIDVDELLHDSLRSSDLAIRTTETRWLVVVNAGANDAEQIMQRIGTSWDEDRKNQADRNLPALTVDPQGTWSVPSQRKQCVECLQKELDISNALFAEA